MMLQTIFIIDLTPNAIHARHAVSLYFGNLNLLTICFSNNQGCSAPIVVKIADSSKERQRKKSQLYFLSQLSQLANQMKNFSNFATLAPVSKTANIVSYPPENSAKLSIFSGDIISPSEKS